MESTWFSLAPVDGFGFWWSLGAVYVGVRVVLGC